jgi:two-component system cell cycle sensor histidine kinase/response regulator CckA
VVLVVDDEDSIRELVKRALENRGYHVLTACEGTEAITLYAQNREAIKLVITDMVMPFMDGAATIRALQRLNPKLKLIAASGIGSNTKITEVEALGVQAFLPKPYALEMLLQTVHKVLESDVEVG